MYRKYLMWIPLIAIIWALFQLYVAGTGPLIAQVQRSLHVAFALALTFAVARKGENSKLLVVRNFDYLLVILSLLSGLYIYMEAERIVSRTQFVSPLTVMDYTVCIIVVLLILEASRRTVGYAMTILAVFFLVYAFYGSSFPGPLEHSGLSMKRMVEVMYYSQDGILGVPIGVAVDYVFYFILFAAFLEISGGGKLFIDLAMRATRRSKGGPAKASVVASSAMGTISGSAVGNVVSTGVFTIPLMKKAGYSPTFSASIEALASTGGQILPPIMGAAAFIMADTLGIPYTEIVLAALIPAILYYVGLYVMVHFQAHKLDLKPTEELASEMDNKKEKIGDRLHLLLPLLLLITLIFTGKTLQLSAFWSIVAVVAISYFRKSTRMSLSNILDSLVSGAKQAIQVSIPCAVAGIIVGVVIHSGLGLKFTSIIIEWSFDINILAVILVSIGCILLGMGMPTTSAYIMAAVLLAPALQKLGFEALASHMFILYFAVFSMITPPVALASYSAASIAKSNANKTGFYAFYLAIPGFLIAYSLVFNPALVLIGEPLDIVRITITTLLGITALSAAIVGYMVTRTNALLRLLFVISALCLIASDGITDIIGLVIFVALYFVQKVRAKKASQTSVTA